EMSSRPLPIGTSIEDKGNFSNRTQRVDILIESKESLAALENSIQLVKKALDGEWPEHFKKLDSDKENKGAVSLLELAFPFVIEEYKRKSSVDSIESKNLNKLVNNIENFLK